MTTDMKIIKAKPIPNGTRVLLATKCGEFMVLDHAGSDITRLKTFDTEPQAINDYIKAPLAQLKNGMAAVKKMLNRGEICATA